MLVFIRELFRISISNYQDWFKVAVIFWLQTFREECMRRMEKALEIEKDVWLSILCLCPWAGNTHPFNTHPFNGPFSRTTQVSWYQKGKTNLILLKQETVSGSGISRTICKSAPCSRQITMPVPHHSVFTGRMPFLLPNQQRQSTEGPWAENTNGFRVVSANVQCLIAVENIFLALAA